MGKGTYHVVGHGQNVNGKVNLYPAMDRLEMEQARIKALDDGDIIDGWTAQTPKGNTILATDRKATHIIICPVCEGKRCFICRQTGITTAKHAAGFREWQRQMAREEVAARK